MTKSRSEHLQESKARALEFWGAGDYENALASMVGDLNDHPETKNFNAYLLALGIIYVNNHDYMGLKHWIEGFR